MRRASHFFPEDRRGAIALMTAILCPVLIGFVALGVEVGDWYQTRQAAQNAADAAAMAGALDLINGVSNLANASYFGTQNGFTNNATPYAGSVQGVSITSGYYNGSSFSTSGGSTNAVKATVSQTVPAYFSAVLGLGTMNVKVSAVALAQPAANACVLSLHNLSISGGPTVNGSGCYLDANGQAQSNGNSGTLNVKGFDASAGCTATNAMCSSSTFVHDWYAAPITDPFASLSAFSVNSGGGQVTVSSNKPATLAPYESNGNVAYGDVKVTGGQLDLQPGTYFFNTLTMNGGTMGCSTCTSSNDGTMGCSTCTGVNIVILATSNGLNINGGATIQLNANTANTKFPSLDTVLIYSRETDSVTVNGNSSSYFGGVVYLPDANVTWGGNGANSMNCTELIGGNITFSGNVASNFNTNGCPSSAVPKVLASVLVQ
jgi:Flp pilus assembly protein TadG